MDARVDPPATLDTVDELTPFAVQFRYTLHTDLNFDQETGVRMAENFEWAHTMIEAPVQARDEG